MNTAQQILLSTSSDIYMPYTRSLLHFEASPFTDDKANTVTNMGSVVLDAAGKFGNCAKFDATTNSYLKLANQGIGLADFTIECQINVDSSKAYLGLTALSFRDSESAQTYGTLLIKASGVWAWYNGQASSFDTNISVTPGTYQHIAIDRYFDGTNRITTVYVDGVQGIARFVDETNYARSSLAFFANNDGSSKIAGRCDEFRATIGRSRYKNAFTPPTAPFLT